MDQSDTYLQPTQLCDFDTDASIRERLRQLVQGCNDERQRFAQVYGFVKELPYGLEDWDVRASETLRKGWGMCCGKTNLLVAMSRLLLIPARYRIFGIRAEMRLLKWVAQQHEDLSVRIGDLPSEQDHVDCEVYLDGDWRIFDPARDTAMEDGLRKLEIPLERVPVAGADDVVYTRLASIDQWARERQGARRFREGREALFLRMNEQLDKIRQLGRQP